MHCQRAAARRSCPGVIGPRNYAEFPSAAPPGATLGQTKNPSAALRPEERLDALRRTGLLDSPQNPAFDRLTRLTCRLLGTPAALVTLVDGGRQLILSQHGLDERWSGIRELPANYVFCHQPVAARAPVVVSDAKTDSASRDDPAIAELGVGAYAGAPLITEDGAALGSLSVIEREPRRWTTQELASLQDLAAIATAEINTRLSAVEYRLHQVERTEAIVQLAGGIAHDFNNLLTGIIGHVTLLLEDSTLSAEAREDLDQIQQSADRAASLTRQLLAYSRRQVLAPRILDLNQLVAGTVSAIRRITGNRIEVTQSLDPGLDSVLADAGQMEQILLQLSSNARESMPDGGRLELRTAPVEIGEEMATRLPGLEPGLYVTLAVSDTGRGMDPPTLERIFDPFFSTKPTSQGAGLGLPSVYGIVKQSGGYIDVRSAPGEGTTFTVYLPRLESATPERDAEPAHLCGTETVLVVEDEDQVRELARRVLERSGYTVIAATDAESAIAMSDRHAGHIHLLITDMVLPRVSGRELAARLGIHRPAIKVLYVSGTSDGAIARHRMLEPGTEFLEKPFSLERLLRKVRQVLGAPEGGRSA